MLYNLIPVTSKVCTMFFSNFDQNFVPLIVVSRCCTYRSPLAFCRWPEDQIVSSNDVVPAAIEGPHSWAHMSCKLREYIVLLCG